MGNLPLNLIFKRILTLKYENSPFIQALFFIKIKTVLHWQGLGKPYSTKPFKSLRTSFVPST